MIVVISLDRPLTSEELSILDVHYAGRLVAVLCPEVENVDHLMRMSVFDGTARGLERFATFISGKQISDLVLRPMQFDRMLSVAINQVLSSSLPRFFTLSGSKLEPYPFAQDFSVGSRGKAILIYPGMMLPAVNGSRQRAFSLFLELLREGYTVEIGDFSKSHQSEYTTFFRQFGAKVTALGAQHSRMDIWLKLQNMVKLILKNPGYRDFNGRLHVTRTRSYRDFLRLNGKDASVVIFSHAWTIPSSVKRLVSARLILDCHDVNYVRDRGLFDGHGLFGKLLSYVNKRLEVVRLAKMDALLAISTADSAELHELGLAAKSILLPPNFGWVAPTWTSNSRAEKFGFIGTNMSANKRSLDYILSEIWPHILELRPTAKLFVAGTICKHLERKTIGLHGIIPLGVVPALQDFYASLDATLSPVLIQGGLNFKIVESLVAGKPVLMNQLAAKSIPESSLTFILDETATNSENAHRFLDFLDAQRKDPAAMHLEGGRLGRLFRDNFTTGFNRAFAVASS
ncbi:glycosyltransferase [Ensifer sp. NBAIM29]|nr:glycosyltransferase [Ensifer sp. NBAIM29]